MMNIQVLGTGCVNCRRLLKNVEEACLRVSIRPTIEYITDIFVIAETGLMKTPGLIIDGKIISSGKVLAPIEIVEVIKKLM
jgi:small redox-active disulfide protein 2